MQFGTLFPRNPDGSLKSKQPCQTEGCDWPNWHLCLKANPDDGNFAQLASKRYGVGKGHGKNVGALQVGRDRYHQNQRAQREAKQSRRTERDEKVIAEYKEGRLSMKAIASRNGIAYQTCRDILHASGIELRPQGVNVGRTSQKGVQAAFN